MPPRQKAFLKRMRKGSNIVGNFFLQVLVRDGGGGVAELGNVNRQNKTLPEAQRTQGIKFIT